MDEASVSGMTVTRSLPYGGSDGVLGFVAAVADSTRTSLSYDGGLPSSGLITFAITFGYTAGGGFLSLRLLQSYTATLVLRVGNGIQIG